MNLSDFRIWLFDLDGTLVTTTAGVIKCMQGVIRDMGFAVPSDRELSSRFGIGLMGTLKPWVGEDRADRAAQMYMDRFSKEVPGNVYWNSCKKTTPFCGMNVRRNSGFRLVASGN